MGWVVNATLRPFYSRERDLVPIGRLGGPQGRSGRVRKISPPTGIRSPDRPALSKSLYRLSYPGPSRLDVSEKKISRPCRGHQRFWGHAARSVVTVPTELSRPQNVQGNSAKSVTRGRNVQKCTLDSMTGFAAGYVLLLSMSSGLPKRTLYHTEVH
jgi:hypothetical protein